jgi:hypothetical protein
MSSSNASIELARLRRSSHWREEDGRVAVEAWRSSGLPLATFARQHGLGPTRIRWWRTRLGEQASFSLSAPSAVVPVTIVGTSAQSAELSRMEIVLASGHVVRIGPDFDADALLKLVRVLETSC